MGIDLMEDRNILTPRDPLSRLLQAQLPPAPMEAQRPQSMEYMERKFPQDSVKQTCRGGKENRVWKRMGMRQGARVRNPPAWLTRHSSSSINDPRLRLRAIIM